MNIASTDGPKVSIVVVPRERFSFTRPSLESVYSETDMPFELIYVDGGSPGYVRDYLDTQSRNRGFELVRRDAYLAPNVARNIGLERANGKYIIFIDNDVLVTPGWLASLVGCAEETGASIVGPLYLIGRPEQQIIHMAGGDAELKKTDDGRILSSKHYLEERHLPEVRDQLQRRSCDLAEFHCMLVDRAVFDRYGRLDEKLLSTREHVDLCLTVRKDGGEVYFEPSSVVAYVPDTEFALSDVAYFRLRWSEEWNAKSLRRFQQKWGLAKNNAFSAKHHAFLKRHLARIKPLFRTAAGDAAKRDDAMDHIAQTNIQLYNQLLALDYSNDQIAAIRSAYVVATKIFSGQFRPCGRPFVCHLVGTASILASCDASPAMVIAGLLHAAYTHGRFGASDSPGVTDDKRERLRRAIGNAAEALVARYTNFPWNDKVVRKALGNVDALPLSAAKMLVIRLANELEDHFDLATLYSGSGKSRMDVNAARFIELAEALGLPALAAAFTAVCRRIEQASVPAVLRSNRDSSYIIAPPRSHPTAAANSSRTPRKTTPA